MNRRLDNVQLVKVDFTNPRMEIMAVTAVLVVQLALPRHLRAEQVLNTRDQGVHSAPVGLIKTKAVICNVQRVRLEQPAPPRHLPVKLGMNCRVLDARHVDPTAISQQLETRTA